MKTWHRMFGPFWIGYVQGATAAFIGVSVWPLRYQMQFGINGFMPYLNFRRIGGDQ